MPYKWLKTVRIFDFAKIPFSEIYNKGRSYKLNNSEVNISKLQNLTKISTRLV